MVRNSIAVQYGRDPTSARIRFYWKQTRGRPRSFFPEPRASWLWPTHGLLLSDGLYLFAIKVRASKAGLGFDNYGVVAIHVSNPQAEPDRWKMSYLAVPVEVVNGESIGGVGTVLSDSGHLYAWFTYNDQRHNAYLARWQLPLMARKKLPPPEWWTTEGWAKGGGAGPEPLLQFSGAADFSVQRLDSTGGMLLTHALGFGKTRISYRTASRITGPWSEPRDLHTPAEWSMPDAFMYSAKSHPELEGGDVVITYNVNSNWAELVRNRNIYYPKFLRAKLVRAGSQLK